MIKAINTFHNGNNFRSKLEAKWAVFFEEVGIEYQYEPKIFSAPHDYLKSYLPDFYLPQLDAYAEVKPLKLERFRGCDFVVDQIFGHEDYPVKWSWFRGSYKLILLTGEPSYYAVPIFYPDFKERQFEYLEFNLFYSDDRKGWGPRQHWHLKTNCAFDSCNFELGEFCKKANKKKFHN